jgi:hypothetical protein
MTRGPADSERFCDRTAQALAVLAMRPDYL